MSRHQSVFLTRDVDALLIPTAVEITIPKATEVLITQTLGGSFTIMISGNLARIEGKDADALGLSVDDLEVVETKEADGPVDLDQVWDQLKSCFDPEIPVNIVDLGLVYKCEIEASEDNKSNKVIIDMTLTAPACSMGPVIAADAETKVRQVKNVTDVHINLVFDPAWNSDMMTDAAKLELGLF